MGSVERPSIQHIHRDEVDKIVQAIVQDGGVIIKNFASVEAVERVNADTLPYLEKDKPWQADNPSSYNRQVLTEGQGGSISTRNKTLLSAHWSFTDGKRMARRSSGFQVAGCLC